MILFLDYDGVLHPSDVYIVDGKPVLEAGDDMKLFMHAPLLERILSVFPEAKIVLSTSWTNQFDFEFARDQLPEALRSRVVDSTWNEENERSKTFWHHCMTRYEQILGYVERHGITNWLAVDDNDRGWPDDQRDRLVHCEDNFYGISHPQVIGQLMDSLFYTYTDELRG